MPEPVAATYSRQTRRGWVLLWCGFVVAGVVLVLAAILSGEAIYAVPGVMLLLAFVPMLLLTLRRFADPRPVIVIDAGGYHDRRLGDPIPWAVIDRLQSDRRGNRVFVQIGVADPARYLGNAGWLRGPMLRSNPRSGFEAIGSNLSGLDVPQDSLAKSIGAWWAAHKA